ncbi:MAG: hypothetical protein RLZZ76_699 [Candidatus Parcubacteria bacterium]|jgi:Leucine-rich repeat (LRR) protein
MTKILLVLIACALLGTVLWQKVQLQEVSKNSATTSEEGGVATQTPNNSGVLAGAIEKATDVKNSIEASSGAVVDLSGQGLTKAPASIFEKTLTTELNLSNNKIDGSLQGEIRFLSGLRVLNLSNNAFTGVPAEVGQLKNLEVLNLSNNKLTGLPQELGNLSKLKVLDLRGNTISEQDLESITAQLPAGVLIQK